MKDTNLPAPKFKKGEPAVVGGIEGKITFISYETGYVRLEHGDVWKALAQIKDLKRPEPKQD